MSPELTFRQKSIRMAASAAICGLSISFIVGEAVDQKAKLLSEWAIDPALIPVHYLPARPAQLAWENLDTLKVTTQLATLNEVVPAVPLDLASIRREFVDVYKTVRSAPVAPAAAPVSAVTPIPAPKVAYAAPAKNELKTAEVEALLLSVHGATKIVASSGTGTRTLSNGDMVIESSPPIPKVNPPPQPVVSTATVSTATWSVRGKVTNAQLLKEPGHFEVGMFSKIDSEGVPVGFPLAQQILPAGRLDFQLNVPAKFGSAFLFGEFVPTKKGAKRFWIGPSVNPWMKGDLQFAELAVQAEDVVVARLGAPSPVTYNEDRTVVQGTIETMFAREGTRIVQPDVVVKVRGRKESARSDKDGKFSLELPKANGTIFLELLKPGYHPTIVTVNAAEAKPVQAHLASREAIDRLAHMLGVRQISAKGVFMGRAASPEGKGLKGLTAQLSLRAEGPFYFGEQGFPASDKKQTTADGRFLFFNVEPGSGYMETSLNGESIIPFQVSSVEGGEMTLKTLVPVAGAIKGRLFNPVAGAKALQPVTGARVRFDGSADWSTTDSYGAFSIGLTKWIRGEKTALEFSAEKFNNHRYSIDFDKHQGVINLYAFPANYIRRLAQSMDVDLDPYTGIVFGKALGPALRMDALADHSTVNGAKDFYFDGNGRLRGSHTMTDPKFGTFVIFNVPKGRSLLQGNDGNGKLRYSDAVVANPSSVTVVME